MSATIYNSKIWKKTLDTQSSFAQNFPEQVDILRTSFKDVRKKANYIADFISNDQPGLTLHDHSHLDALWETAEIIGGEELELNPIEAYIFGCAVLFHDLGMALCLWDDQIDMLKRSKEYKDILFEKFASYLGRNPCAEDYCQVPEKVEKAAVSERLRALHASKARELPLKSWSFNGDLLYLIEHSDLRIKLGDKIGLIAESHWWNVDDIRSHFDRNVISPAPTSFPLDWTINNIKLACLLRLADYIHIDDRRAPTLAFSVLKPTGLSRQHWVFQNKLHRAYSDGERLSFESHSNFRFVDYHAWWLAYETILSIDREIRVVDNLLYELDIKRFGARWVKGIETPLRFAQYVKTEGWEPENTQFKISNTADTINKLSGVQLYGDHRLDVPLRELIQNASDAVQAKMYYSPDHHGLVNVRFYTIHGKEWLEVEDNGIGMSKSALLDGLLDFGNSYWKSHNLRQEHPGLLTSDFQPTGNFGVGFFSVFMVADYVQVVTKSINGLSTFVLEVDNGLNGNPILKSATGAQERFESGTLVRLAIRKNGLLDIMVNRFEFLGLTSDIVTNPLNFVCSRLAPALGVDLLTTYEFGHSIQAIKVNDWKSIDPLILLERVSEFEFDDINRRKNSIFTRIAKFITPIFSDDGNEMIARGTIVPFTNAGELYPERGRITVGGLSQATTDFVSGIWIGKNTVITRDYAYPVCTYKELGPWLKGQYDLIIKDDGLDIDEKVEISERFYGLGFIPRQLPIATDGRVWHSYDDIAAMDHGDHVILFHGLSMMEMPFNKEFKQSSFFITSRVSKMGGLHWRDTETNTWIANLANQDTGVAEYDRTVVQYSLLSLTIKAIGESWGVTESEIASETIIIRGEPLYQHLLNWYDGLHGGSAVIVLNPRKTNKEMYLTSRKIKI